ncbi:MAG: LytTR family transcriptional regulator DNA-binding domain-containing protein [Clostridioides sp.]|jgi:DNA-binding LytR/AlgR family response regulator|nr:LytTR family transcriptional regulator DNA-binding domain-containing protein [Clostridioides sp.]
MIETGLNQETVQVIDDYEELFQYKVNGKISFELKNRIKFFQIKSRIIKIHTINGKIETFYGSMDELDKELSGDGFVRIHKSYLVNSKYVKQFSHNKVLLYDESELPVSRTFSKSARQFFLEKISHMKNKG